MATGTARNARRWNEPRTIRHVAVLVESVAMTDLLTPAEATRLASIHQAWAADRAARNWARADRLRGYLERAGCMGANLERWHPVFEEPKHRRRRLRERESTGSHE